MKENSNYSALATKMWITKGSRFNAYRRLDMQGRSALWAIGILSISSIVLVALELSGYSNTEHEFTLASLAISLFVLVFSLMEAINNSLTRASEMLMNAKKVAKLLDQLLIAEGKQDINAVEIIASDYHLSIDDLRDNHKKVDYDLFRAQKFSDFSDELSRFEKYLVYVWYFVRNFWLEIVVYSLLIIYFATRVFDLF